MLSIVPEPIRQLQSMLSEGKVTQANLSMWLCALINALALYVNDKRTLTPVRRALLVAGGNSEIFQKRLTGGFERLLMSAIENGEVSAEPVLPPDMFGLQQAVDKLEQASGDAAAARIVLDLFCHMSKTPKKLVQSWLGHRMITGIYVNNLASNA